ncbi:AAA family ATPase [Coleofasciculus sp. FACHB-712]|uniref:AAA family ATPase n=1 Tax=Coleofasciculus sp. FACHB-712 TaxID=2692789 RepID=UPI001688510F|nr:AAA family ATPase [Coleofasciculus sp. FACHB-712]
MQKLAAVQPVDKSNQAIAIDQQQTSATSSPQVSEERFDSQEQAIAHLTALGYNRGEPVHMRYIHPVTKKSAKKPKLIFDELESYQNQGYDAYFVVNPGGDCDADINAGRAIFYEHDDLEKEAQLYLWEELGLPEPTIQVDTGGKSIHSFWVFSKPIPVYQWRQLQTDLLEHSKGDRSLKNPSRILRLAGSRYMKGDRPGTTQAQIVSNSGKRYEYETLRATIPMELTSRLATLSYQTIEEDVPLYQCLRTEDRQLIDNGTTIERNNAGAALAFNLIGTSNRLNQLGIRYSGAPRQLFEDYCSRCPSGGGWNQREWDGIWKSAQKKNPSAALTDEALINCMEAWRRKQQTSRQPQPNTTLQEPSSQPAQNKLSLGQATEQAREILKSDDDELTINLKLEKVRETCEMSSYDWERKIIKPLKRDLDSDRFKLELLALLRIDDPIERIRQQALLAPKYQMSSSSLEKALGLMKQRTVTAQTKVYDIEELLDLETQRLTWLIPEMLPAGETIILAAPPKVGKTLLAIDVAFAVATGEGTFLGETTKKGKVLIVEADESLQSTRAKLLNRGFRRQDRGNVRILPKWNISQMGLLEEQLEDFRPDLVIVDSLRRINHGSDISENSAEFADNIYTLKETLQRYGAAGILIHHSNKDRDAQGVHQLRGSSAIAGAVWGTWQMESIPKPDPNNKKRLVIDPKDPNRALSIFSRDCEGQKLFIELDPENNSWIKRAEPEQAQKETVKERILEVFRRNSHKSGLTGIEVIELLGMTKEQGRGVYQELSRMASRLLISCKPAPGNKRQKLYSLPENTLLNPLTPPSPTLPPKNVEDYPENLENTELENTQQITQQLLNNYSTTTEKKQAVEGSNSDSASSPAILNNSPEKQGGGGVELHRTEQVSVSTQAFESKFDTAAPMDESSSPGAEKPKFEVYSTVAGADEYNANYAFHGYVEDVQGDKVLVRWQEREGKPGNQAEWYQASELRLIQWDGSL